jgi:ABC-type dipeptide/oligopeptide/nickel transport system ATPase component
MAQIIQQPKRKIFHCIAIKGQKGTGKTIYVHHFMELFGDAAVEISDSEILTNQFNAILADRILVYGDEAFWSGDRKNRGKLKNLISSDTIRITYKMKDTITMPNHLRFMFTTNEDWAAPVENEERRWVTLRCGEARMNDRDYFGRMEAQMENGGYNALMKLLLERDISQRDWSHVPMTEASKEDMAYTTVGDNVVAEYLDQCVGGMEFGDVFSTFTSGTVPSSTFTSAVKEYASKSKAYPSITPAYVASKLKDIFGRDFKSEQKKEDGKRNIRVFKFGSIDEVEKKINAYYNREEEVE